MYKMEAFFIQKYSYFKKICKINSVHYFWLKDGLNVTRLISDVHFHITGPNLTFNS